MENENLNEQQIQESELEQEPVAAVEEPVAEPLAEEVAEHEAAAEEAAEEQATQPETVAEEPVIVPAAPAIKKGYTAKVVLITLLCVVLAAALVVGVLAGAGVIFNDDGEVQETTENVEETTENVEETTLNVDLKSYTVSDEEAVAAQNTVVATVGDLQLTNSALQVDYWTSVYEYYSSYGYYLYLMGVDFSQPLDTLVYDAETNTSWQSFLLEYSLSIWHQYAAIQLVAEANNFVMTEDQLAYMNEMDSYMEQVATENSFATVEDLVKAQMGVGATVQGYKEFTDLAYKASCYVESYQESLDPTDEELDAYFTENADSYAESGITKESGNLVDVRHILVMPEGGTEDESGNVTYSEEEWETCRQKAQDLYDQWLEGDATEDSFAEMAGEHSEDPGSSSNGGLYSGVAAGDMVTEFNDWIFDESRAHGDHGLVKTTYGYHIMFFVDAQPQWLSVAKSDYLSEMISNMVTEAIEQYPLEVDYDAIALSEMTLG